MDSVSLELLICRQRDALATLGSSAPEVVMSIAELDQILAEVRGQH
ncbi:hypothetical protein HQQ80_01900 [Microbacteriaceae bacterium VKM Ac-2855]|nr:hypothetical protein [Microbacteriaceae bacterium VKM Ac-2855]